MNEKLIKHFVLLTQITLLFVFLVILAGSVVRATGSGMGCPDWPKCFGKLIPPTDVSQLPENYKDLYAGEHHAVAEFNALNTWVEYINRLFGAILGMLIFVQFVFSFKFRKEDKLILILSFIEFIFIGFEAWLGAKVVSSNLAPMKITIHMAGSLVILSVGLGIIHRVKKIGQSQIDNKISPQIKTLLIGVLFFSILQIMLGTQVREQVDVLLKNFDDAFRSQLIDNLGNSFKIHRSFSILILALNFWLVYKILKSDTNIKMKNISKFILVTLLIEVVAGVVLSRMALPAFVQPIHLVFACIIYALQFSLLLKVFQR
jgi:cytochrome c oxidase assembly protein subunit 15